MRDSRLIRNLTLAASLALTTSGALAQHHDHSGHNHAHGHAHGAPHDGTLVLVGDHFAHLEFVIDAKKGKLTAYVLDGEAEKSIRIKQPEIEVELGPYSGIRAAKKGEKDAKGQKAATGEKGAKEEKSAAKDTLESTITLRLQGQGSPLTGESIGNTSEFSVKSDKLKGVKYFDGVVPEVTIKGTKAEDVMFRFPEGNE